MTDDRPGRSTYHVSSRVLARKGGAEPLPTTGKPIVLAAEYHRTATDDEHLTDAVTDATLEILMEPPRKGRAPRGAAPLTDLLDPALIEATRRKRNDFER